MDGSLSKQPSDRPQLSPADLKYVQTAQQLSTAQPNRSLRRNLEAEYDEPLPMGLDVPESYLIAMKALQQQLSQCQNDLVVSKGAAERLGEENALLKSQLMASEKEKLESEVRTNEILRDYNTLSQVLDQSRLEGMVLKKEVEQLKRQKQNVLEKVTEKVCKQRAIDVLEQQQLNRRAESLRKENINAIANEISSSRFRTPYLKQAISTELPVHRISELPLVTLNPNGYKAETPLPSLELQRQSTTSLLRQPTPSISSLYEHRYEPVVTQRTSEASSLTNTGYVQLLKDLMRNEKLLVEMNHQLECYQKQLLDGQHSHSRTSKQQLLLKIDILRKDIIAVKNEIAEGRRRQSLM